MIRFSGAECCRLCAGASNALRLLGLCSVVDFAREFASQLKHVGEASSRACNMLGSHIGYAVRGVLAHVKQGK